MTNAQIATLLETIDAAIEASLDAMYQVDRGDDGLDDAIAEATKGPCLRDCMNMIDDVLTEMGERPKCQTNSTSDN